MKLVYASLYGAASAAVDDDAVLLSVASVRESLGGESMYALVDFAREGSPRKAQQLLQQFAKNTLARSEAVDDVTKQKLKEIGAQLTNNTWMALEQAHRRDQDLINKHWRAIKECGDKHIAHLQQDVDGFEVQQVRTHESDMIKCRGLPDHVNPFHTGLLQSSWSIPPPEMMCPEIAKGDVAPVHGGDGSSKCYFVNRQTNMDINGARDWCTTHGGELASIHSDADNNAVLTLLAGTSAWIGAKGTECPDKHTVCKWTWEDGTNWEDITWPTDGLNHNNFRLHETRIAVHSDRRWHDWVHGESPKGAVCQRKASPPACCMAMEASCLACSAGMGEDEYCALHPMTAGCPQKICCRAMSAQCLACTEGLTEEEYCKLFPSTAGCPRKNTNGHIGTDQVLESGATIDYEAPDTELPDDYDTVAWLADTPFAIYKQDDGSYQRYFTHVSKMYNHEGGKYYKRSLLAVKNEVCDKCGELDAFLKELPASKPNCEPTLVATEIDPRCTTDPKPLIETDLDQWFDNLITFADYNLEKWQQLKAACDAARAEYAEMDAHCDEEQVQYESSFCAYRQGLHSTCAEYQGCHILTEEQFLALIQDVLYAADSRKIDWKAIHKIACYIKVLISDGTNQERTYALENCESGNLNTLATILTGFNETNYLSLIIPEISGNVSCWDMDVPPLIDFKECDMSSVHQYPCTETWMDRYEGLESPSDCVACAALPEHMQYSDKDYQDTTHHRMSEYGGGWIFVNELGRSTTDIDDLAEIQPEGYYLPSYNMKGLRFNEVLIQRTSPNWCDSWGLQSSKWVEDGGASMCVQADNEHVYCMSNHEGHTWRQQPTSHFAALCGRDGQPACECWPFEEGLEHVCFAHGATEGPGAKNVLAPRHVTIHSLEDDGSVVKVSFRGEEKNAVLRVGNYGSFLDGVGCGAVTPVTYRVFVRCLGCVTERSDFHTKDGAQFNGPMTMGKLGKNTREEYTYEAWFRSPLEGKFRREIFGGATAGLVLVNEGNANCENFGDGVTETTSYQVHLGNTNVYSKTCFRKNLMYHVAVTKSAKHGVHVMVNGKEVTFRDENGKVSASQIGHSFGGGFTDGGQLFNVRIWDYARSQVDILSDAAVTDVDLLTSAAGLAHWWPLTDDIQDVMTGTPLEGPEVRYAPIWCSDLEATGMRVC